jgi:hypothetical protein
MHRLRERHGRVSGHSCKVIEKKTCSEFHYHEIRKGTRSSVGALRRTERLPEGDQKGMRMHRSLFVSMLQAAGLQRDTHSSAISISTVIPQTTAAQGLSGGWALRLIYLAAAAQLLNLLLATYVTQLLGYQDLLLSIFGNWGLALFIKLLALGLWVVFREFLEARFAAWLIAPISLFALLHDILMLV